MTAMTAALTVSTLASCWCASLLAVGTWAYRIGYGLGRDDGIMDERLRRHGADMERLAAEVSVLSDPSSEVVDVWVAPWEDR